MPMDEWEIHPDDLSPAQREVADLIGFENYLKLIDVYAAETIYIPKRDSFERIARNQRIVEEYNLKVQVPRHLDLLLSTYADWKKARQTS